MVYGRLLGFVFLLDMRGFLVIVLVFIASYVFLFFQFSQVFAGFLLCSVLFCLVNLFVVDFVFEVAFGQTLHHFLVLDILLIGFFK